MRDVEVCLRGAVRCLIGIVLLCAGRGEIQPAAQSIPTMAVPATLQLEGGPPIPQPLADAIAPYASFRQAAFSSWHPTERRMLVTTRLGDTFQAYSLSAPLAAPVQATFQETSVGSWTPGSGN